MKESIMSFFNAPITNKVPSGVCSVAGLHAYISSDSHLKELTQRVRADTENDKAFRGKKQTLLPYVTPAGIFSYCREQCIMVPSGDFVIDIDHLPGAKGVKLFVPYRLNLTDTLEHSFDNALHTAWDYLGWRHGLKADTANADMSRACFLAYDEEAKCKI